MGYQTQVPCRCRSMSDHEYHAGRRLLPCSHYCTGCQLRTDGSYHKRLLYTYKALPCLAPPYYRNVGPLGTASKGLVQVARCWTVVISHCCYRPLEISSDGHKNYSDCLQFLKEVKIKNTFIRKLSKGLKVYVIFRVHVVVFLQMFLCLLICINYLTAMGIVYMLIFS